MRSMNARITITPEPYTATVLLPLIPSELLAIQDGEHIASELIDLGITDDQHVVAQLRDVPSGCAVRKLTGEALYLRADDNFARRKGAITGEQIVMICDGYRVSLWAGETHVVVLLSELIGEQGIEALRFWTEDK